MELQCVFFEEDTEVLYISWMNLMFERFILRQERIVP